MLATLSSKGQITIPVTLRNQLNINTGDVLNFVLTKDDIIELIPVRTPVHALKGIVDKPKKPVTLEEMDIVIGTGGQV